MRRALSVLSAVVVMSVTAKASAAFHVMKVVEVFAGSPAAPDAHYVQLQMYAAGQNVVGGHFIKVYDAAGNEIVASRFTFGANVANGADQATILVGTAAVSTSLGVDPDFTLPQPFATAGGAVCFEDVATPSAIDCFSWGTFAGAAGDSSVSPLAAFSGLAAKRKIDSGASAALLEEADDGNNNALDFAHGAPAPKNNNGVVGSLGDAGAPLDGGVSDAATPSKDSGVSTVPTPPREGGTAVEDAGATPAGGASDDSGCSLVARPSEGWSATLGLLTAAAMLAVSRRRASASASARAKKSSARN